MDIKTWINETLDELRGGPASKIPPLGKYNLHADGHKAPVLDPREDDECPHCDGTISVNCHELDCPTKWADNVVKQDPREEILDEAKQYVTQDRNLEHGEPEDNFANIASLWTPWLKMRFGFTGELTPFDIAEMMSLFKKARKAYSPENRDNHADDVGYCSCSWYVVQKENK